MLSGKVCIEDVLFLALVTLACQQKWSFSEGRKSIKLRRFLCCVIQRMFLEQERYTVEYFSVKKLKSINLRWLIFVRPKILHFPRIYIRKSAFRDSRIKTLCKDLLLRMGLLEYLARLDFRESVVFGYLARTYFCESRKFLRDKNLSY